MARSDARFRETYNALLDLCAELAPEDPLPSENALGDRLGVSRTVVRACLQRASEDGLIRWDGRVKTLLRAPLPDDRMLLGNRTEDPETLEKRFLEWILRFDVPAGTPLNVAALSREFGVTPQMLQEFLAGLSRFGLVERRKKGGWLLLGFTAAFAVELSEFRSLLEINAVQQLVTLPGSHPIWPKLDALRADHLALLDRIETDFHAFSPLDERFHATINSVVQNRFVAEFQKVIALIFHYHYMWDKTLERHRNQAAIGEHLALLDALLLRDAAASEQAARRHLLTSKTTLLSSLRDHRLG
ncbi:GntR family transcriptional regulator [Salipiger sp. H15]|uniref:GntR family transcriptional regulator n=1 Tax=Alloyangia sp. H15 TaxID=3029062 RepID=A0AAU8AMA0_9RHOB